MSREQLFFKADGSGEFSGSDDQEALDDERAAALVRSLDSEGSCQDAEGAREEKTVQAADSGREGAAFYHKLHDEASEQQKKKEFRKQLNSCARQAVRGSQHDRIRMIVHRPEAGAQQREEYLALMSELAPVVRELVQKTKSVLEYQVSESFSKHKVYGSKFVAESAAVGELSCFARKRPPREEPSLIVALRVDESASMASFGRLPAAKKACAAVYEFCRQCGVPVLIYGDTADTSKLEQMSLYAYCDPSQPTEEDGWRLMTMRGRGNNRDGMALRILAEKLVDTPYTTKLLISVSDGQPRALPDYSGESAIGDVKGIVKDYSRRGITFLAAAIGQDKEVIQEIYGGERFLDVSKLSEFPRRLVGMIARHMGS